MSPAERFLTTPLAELTQRAEDLVRSGWGVEWAGREASWLSGDTELATELASDFAWSRLGMNLVSQVAWSGEGRELARQLAWSDEGRELASRLAWSDEGRELARRLAWSGEAVELASRLAGSGEAVELASQFVRSDEGRELASRLVRSGEAVELASQLVRSDEGRELASRLVRSDEGRELADELAALPWGREVAVDGVVAAAVILFAGTVLTSLTLVPVVVAASLDDSPVPSDPRLREHLGTEDIAAVRAATEPFQASVQRYLNDEQSGPDEVDENYLRSHLSILATHFDIIEGADPADIRRAIGKIVDRLIKLGMTHQDRVRTLLEHDLGGTPPETIDDVVNHLEASLRHAASWASEPDSDKRDNEAVVGAVADAATEAKGADSAPVQLDKEKAKSFADRFKEQMPTALATALVNQAVNNAGSLLALLGGALQVAYGVDALGPLIEAARMLPQLADVFLIFPGRSSDDDE